MGNGKTRTSTQKQPIAKPAAEKNDDNPEPATLEPKKEDL